MSVRVQIKYATTPTSTPSSCTSVTLNTTDTSISGLKEMIKAQRKLHDNTTSIFDLLLKARALKLEKRGQFWQLKNARKKDLDVLEKVGFKPQERFQA